MLVVFDLDGTLCDNSAREHLARAAAGNFGSKTAKHAAWQEFHSHIMDDTPIQPVLDTLFAFDNCGAKHRIELWTARPEEYRPQTQAWLVKWDVPYFLLRMRRDGDWRPSYQIKMEWAAVNRPGIVFEDHPVTVAHMRAAGIVVAQVGEQTDR